MRSKHSLASLFVAAGLALSGCNLGSNVDDVAPSDPAKVGDLPPIEVAEGDWPWWMADRREFKFDGPLPPLRWGPDENIVWKAAVPGRGHSTPAVWGERIFLTTADEKEETQSLLCFAREDGSLLWQKRLHDGPLLGKHTENTHASPTPACDGERVFTAFPTGGGVQLSAVSVDGEILWQKEVGKLDSRHGYGSSPILYKSLVIVLGDSSAGGFLAAYHRKSGELVWQRGRDNSDSYSTPNALDVAGKTQLVVAGQDQVISYDPASGKTIWTCDGPTDTIANTPVANRTHVFVSGGYPGRHVMCIRADGEGDVTDTHLEWKIDLEGYVPTPLVVGDRVFVVQGRRGLVSCLDAKTGESLWQERLKDSLRASPVLVDGHIFALNRSGRTFIFKAADSFELVARNDLGDGTYATPLILDGKIYYRGEDTLYCIGQPQPGEQVSLR